ncbi:hypothetical protein ACLQ2R_17445 [Streptosporangium sp. DT93]|uniref:hypothetical protein n=1 Tax=Streptosporangium sp. DT93 TaxID=3393428 RepID=UPI003CECBAA7
MTGARPAPGFAAPDPRIARLQDELREANAGLACLAYLLGGEAVVTAELRAEVLAGRPRLNIIAADGGHTYRLEAGR